MFEGQKLKRKKDGYLLYDINNQLGLYIVYGAIKYGPREEARVAMSLATAYFDLLHAF